MSALTPVCPTCGSDDPAVFKAGCQESLSGADPFHTPAEPPSGAQPICPNCGSDRMWDRIGGCEHPWHTLAYHKERASDAEGEAWGWARYDGREVEWVADPAPKPSGIGWFRTSWVTRKIGDDLEAALSEIAELEQGLSRKLADKLAAAQSRIEELEGELRTAEWSESIMLRDLDAAESERDRLKEECESRGLPISASALARHERNNGIAIGGMRAEARVLAAESALASTREALEGLVSLFDIPSRWGIDVETEYCFTGPAARQLEDRLRPARSALANQENERKK